MKSWNSSAYILSTSFCTCILSFSFALNIIMQHALFSFPFFVFFFFPNFSTCYFWTLLRATTDGVTCLRHNSHTSTHLITTWYFSTFVFFKASIPTAFLNGRKMLSHLQRVLCTEEHLSRPQKPTQRCTIFHAPSQAVRRTDTYTTCRCRLCFLIGALQWVSQLVLMSIFPKNRIKSSTEHLDVAAALWHSLQVTLLGQIAQKKPATWIRATEWCKANRSWPTLNSS